MMRFFAKHTCSALLACGTLLIFGPMSAPARGQDAGAQATMRSEMSIFDAFLDAHGDIDAQLRANPSLLNNAEFLEAHPQLQSFLNQHPNIQAQVKQNPSFFMQREKRFDARENRRGTNPNPDLTRGELATMDQFLDKYPRIDQDLRRNPSLVNNAEYLEAHPELQTFLNQHPNVKEEIAENPRYFMQRENRFDAREPGRNPNPDLTRGEVATMDQFLDKYPRIDQDLRRNPSLLTNADYLKAHPELQAFLDQHPNVREEAAENPRYFMQRENRFDAQEPGRNPNPDLTRGEVATMDQFLDKYPRIDQDLRRNPSLLTNADYLKAHPELQAFLNQHPNVREEAAENPRYFMQRENRFDAQEPGRNPNPDLTRGQLATMDQFLDKYPRIDQDLRRNPSLVNNGEYLESHPELQAFLSQHPNLKEEIAENPRYFMQRENRFDAQEPPRDRDRDRDARAANGDRDRDRDFDRDRDRDRNDVDRRSNPNPDLNNRELASMDRFLDQHPDVAKSLEKKPQLINDNGYLNRHKDLQEFLSEHPGVREEFRENPSYFMSREQRFEATNRDRDFVDRDRDANRDRNRDRDEGVDRERLRDRDRDRGRDVDNDLTNKELQEMDHFLDKHKKIDHDLQKEPTLVNDKDYLRHHKSLDSFLSKNPKVSEEFRENPKVFMQREQRLEMRNHRMHNEKPVAKPKTKIEEKEQMHTATPH